jgi:hypothetical protein
MESLRSRITQSQDFTQINIKTIKKSSGNKILQPRIALPPEVEVYQYSGQKLNIWEFQKEQLRKNIVQD